MYNPKSQWFAGQKKEETSQNSPKDKPNDKSQKYQSSNQHGSGVYIIKADDNDVGYIKENRDQHQDNGKSVSNFIYIYLHFKWRYGHIKREGERE